jgi:uncharacterized protein YegP (UPF0339 family)
VPYKSAKLLRRQKWRFRVEDAANGKVLAWSESYHNLDDCLETLRKVVGAGVKLETPRVEP